jgi:hypothetical protein
VDLSAAERAKLAGGLHADSAAKLRSLVGEAALTRAPRMKEKFHEAFALDEQGTPR